jgi:hypothetical protein
MIPVTSLVYLQITIVVNFWHGTIRTLYGYKCGSPLPWDEVGVRQLISPESVHDSRVDHMHSKVDAHRSKSTEKLYG